MNMENQNYWKARREQREQEEKHFRENLIESVMKEYGFNEAVAILVVNKGWEDGHHAGYAEVQTMTSITADFVDEVLKASKQ